MTNTNPFNPYQSLSGPSLRLEPVTQSDFDDLFAVASDPNIWKQHPQHDRYQKEVFEDFFNGAVNSRSAYKVIEKKNGTTIGSSRFHNPNYDNSSIEIGWTFLAYSHWGGQYNAELKDIMLQFALEYFNEVHFCIGDDNIRSQKAARKLGAQLSSMQDPSRPGNVFYVLTAKTYVGLNNYGKAES